MASGAIWSGRPYRLFGWVADVNFAGSQLEVVLNGSAAAVSSVFVQHVQGRAPQVLLGQKVTLYDYNREGFARQTTWQRKPQVLVSHSAAGAQVHVFQGRSAKLRVQAAQGVVFQFVPTGLQGGYQ